MDVCLRCGSSAIAEVSLVHGAEFRPDEYGVEPETGDVIVECQDCSAFVVVLPEQPVLEPAKPPKAKPPKAKPRARAKGRGLLKRRRG